jgi:hypothetical protein
MTEVTNTPAPFVPGFRLIDGSALNAALAGFLKSTDSGIVASTVQTRVGAKALSAVINQVTSANASDAVSLPPSGANPTTGQPYSNLLLIDNTSGQTIQVFPGGANDVLDGGAVGAAGNLSNAKAAWYAVVSDIGGVRTWISMAATKAT